MSAPHKRAFARGKAALIGGKKKKVFVGMSGGVDSSVAAYLLKKEGLDVTGVFMRCWNDKSSDALKVGVPCSTAQDAEDARRVAGKLGIPFYVWDFEEEYKKKVVEYMVEGYRKGETPNPDVMCNHEIKFGLFLKRALELGANYLATGHYVRRSIFSRTGVAFAPAANAHLHSRSSADPSPRHSESFSKNYSDSYVLKEAKDKNKDQSYFLWTLTQSELKHCLFPIGDYLKKEVREIAKKAGLPTAEKKDSQGICFLGQVSLVDFLKDYIPEKRGKVMSIAGEKLGEHKGAQFYTIGQRHGLDLKEKNTALHIRGEHITKPHYVTEKNVETNTVTVAEGNNNPALFRKEIFLRDVNLLDLSYSSILKNTGIKGSRVLARVRYRQPVSPAILTIKKKGVYKLVFKNAQKFVAPGQSAVFYLPAKASASAGKQNLEMLGGGVISK